MILVASVLIMGILDKPRVNGFTENFRLLPPKSRWLYQLNGGSIRMGPKEFTLEPKPDQSGYPAMWTRPGLLPTGADFQLDCAFRFPIQGPYGVSFSVRSESTGENLIFFHCDDQQNGVGSVIHGNASPKKLKVRDWIRLRTAKAGSHWTVFVDDRLVADFDYPDQAMQIFIGNNVSGLNPWKFSTIAVDHITVSPN